MKLIYNISLRLSLVLFPLIALWAVVFLFYHDGRDKR